MSANLEGSELDLVNTQAGKGPVQVSDDLFMVIERALELAEKSGGAFDPAIGPLVKLWDIGFGEPRIPPAEEIGRALALTLWREVRLDRAKSEVFLPRPGMALDLGAIAKGYAADEAARILEEAGVRRAIIDLGGNIYASGTKAGGKPWRVGIQDPLEERGTYAGVLEVSDTSIVTSGLYERFFEINGQRYHHILSTIDGYPVRNGLLSVTVISPSSTDADALATAAFALGYEKGMALISSLGNTEALFILDDFTIRGTAGALERFTLSSPGYSVEQFPPNFSHGDTGED